MAIAGGLVLVAEGVAGVVDQANPCGLAAGLGLSNAGLGPAYILVAGGFRLVCGRLVCAGRVQGMGMGMGVVAFAGHGGFRRAWWQAAVAGKMPYSHRRALRKQDFGDGSLFLSVSSAAARRGSPFLSSG